MTMRTAVAFLLLLITPQICSGFAHPIVSTSRASRSQVHASVTAQQQRGGMAKMQEGGLKVIIAGAPASGKGTQCELIQEKFKLVHLSTGDMLRAAVAAETEVGLKAKEAMESGQLVADDLIIGIVKDRLAEEDCASCGWLLDGFPRTSAQADALNAAGIVPDKVVFLDVPDEALIERVVGRRSDPETGKIYHITFSPPEDPEVAARLTQRADDTVEAVKVRLEQFHKNMGAIKECYSDILVTMNGNQKKEDVWALVDACLSDK